MSGGCGEPLISTRERSSLTIALFAALATAAHASNIAYISSDGNVWVTSPDGSVKHQVTTDGAAMKYATPS